MTSKFVVTKKMKKHRAFQFWMPALSAVLDIYLVLEILITLFTGESLTMLIFGAGHNPIVDKVIDILPTDPVIFFLMCAVILSFLCILAFALIWASFYSYRSIKFGKVIE
jgi:hypothetical protein